MKKLFLPLFLSKSTLLQMGLMIILLSLLPLSYGGVTQDKLKVIARQTVAGGVAAHCAAGCTSEPDADTNCEDAEGAGDFCANWTGPAMSGNWRTPVAG